MTQMGPEALLMTAAAIRQSELAQFSRLEYSRMEAPRVRATLLSDFEAMPTKRSGTNLIYRWGARLFRLDDPRKAIARSLVFDAAVGGAASGRSPSAAGLAALPALGLGARVEATSPLSVLPMLGRRA